MNTSAIWTKDFILNCIVCFVVNQSYYMTMVVIADYAATALHASLAEAGLACGIFILGTLFARLFLGGCIERIGLKRFLYIGLFLFLAASLLNIGIHSLYLLYAARFVQGVGFGLSSSTTGTIMAHLVRQPAAAKARATMPCLLRWERLSAPLPACIFTATASSCTTSSPAAPS